MTPQVLYRLCTWPVSSRKPINVFIHIRLRWNTQKTGVIHVSLIPRDERTMPIGLAQRGAAKWKMRLFLVDMLKNGRHLRTFSRSPIRPINEQGWVGAWKCAQGRVAEMRVDERGWVNAKETREGICDELLTRCHRRFIARTFNCRLLQTRA